VELEKFNLVENTTRSRGAIAIRKFIIFIGSFRVHNESNTESVVRKFFIKNFSIGSKVSIF